MATKRPIARRRGWIALGAGVFLVVLSGAIAAFIASLSASPNFEHSPSADNVLGRTYIALAILVVCGALGIGNGVYIIRNAKMNLVLTLAIVLLFVAALVTVATGLGS